MSGQSTFRPRLLVAGFCAAIFLLIALIVSRSTPEFGGYAAASVPQKAEPVREEPERQSAALQVADSTSARALGLEIDRLIDESEFAKARWGIFVTSLRDSSVVYARNADKPIGPASNMKIFTTAVALDLLGADYRWRTSVYAKTDADKTGIVAGNLVLYGRGAPDLSSFGEKHGAKSSLDQLADALYDRGVRRINGDIVGDESYLKGDALGDGWLWNDVQWYFGAEVSALSINDNQIEIAITPSQKPGEKTGIRLKPEVAYVEIRNETSTAQRDAPATVGITRGLSDNNVRVWGDFPLGGRSLIARLAVHRPSLWAATLFRDALTTRGIVVEGRARAVDARGLDAKAEPKGDVELASVTSAPLGEIVRLTNKESVNLYAELILRTLGKERGSSAPDPDPKKMFTRGDDAAGAAVIRHWLEEQQIPADAIALHDGSGLSRLDLITPEATARLLVSISKAPTQSRFRDSLPIAGRDGTLRFRLRGVAGKILAKTGTQTYNNSLSGYLTTADGEQLAFSIICNDTYGGKTSTPLIDRIAALLTTYRASHP